MLESLYKRPLKAFDEMTRDRILSRVIVQGNCLMWTGSLSTRGYGQCSVGRKDWRFHRLMYTMFVGPIPDGLLLRHTCDNPPCGHPDHLIPGDCVDNAEDARERGRLAIGSKAGPAKLTEEQILEIRARAALRSASYHDPINGAYALAKEFGVSRPTISYILRNETWKHV